MGGTAQNWLAANMGIETKNLTQNQEADKNFNTNTQTIAQDRFDVTNKRQEERRHLGERANDILQRFDEKRDRNEQITKEQAVKDAEAKTKMDEAAANKEKARQIEEDLNSKNLSIYNQSPTGFARNADIISKTIGTPAPYSPSSIATQKAKDLPTIDPNTNASDEDMNWIGKITEHEGKIGGV